jgi:hypothetical protein
MTNAHSETGQMAVCCQNLMLGVLSSHSVLSMLVGMLFKKFHLFLNSPSITHHVTFTESSVDCHCNKVIFSDKWKMVGQF